MAYGYDSKSKPVIYYINIIYILYYIYYIKYYMTTTTSYNYNNTTDNRPRTKVGGG